MRSQAAKGFGKREDELESVTQLRLQLRRQLKEINDPESKTARYKEAVERFAFDVMLRSEFEGERGGLGVRDAIDASVFSGSFRKTKWAIIREAVDEAGKGELHPGMETILRNVTFGDAVLTLEELAVRLRGAGELRLRMSSGWGIDEDLHLARQIFEELAVSLQNHAAERKRSTQFKELQLRGMRGWVMEAITYDVLNRLPDEARRIGKFFDYDRFGRSYDKVGVTFVRADRGIGVAHMAECSTRNLEVRGLIVLAGQAMKAHMEGTTPEELVPLALLR